MPVVNPRGHRCEVEEHLGEPIGGHRCRRGYNETRLPMSATRRVIAEPSPCFRLSSEILCKTLFLKKYYLEYYYVLFFVFLFGGVMVLVRKYLSYLWYLLDM